MVTSRPLGSFDGDEPIKPGITQISSSALPTHDETDTIATDTRPSWIHKFSRSSYSGALLFNISTFILPALYGTLSKLWIASISSSSVATTDSYTYVSVIIEVVNEGLPKAAYLLIGDKASRSLQSRLKLSSTLIVFQTVLGFVVSLCIFAAAGRFAATFVPEAEKESVRYVRIASFSAGFSALDVAVSFATRSLDRPDVPLVISTVNTILKLTLDLLFISKIRVVSRTTPPRVTTQAAIRLACDGASAIVGLLYFIFTAFTMASQLPGHQLTDPSSTADHPPSIWARCKQILKFSRPRFDLLAVLAKEGIYFGLESAVRNILYLWLVANIVQMGSDYATAWGVFNTIRWGLVMVPVMALDVTSSTFVGHAWGRFRAQIPLDSDAARPKASRRELYMVAKPALVSLAVAVAVEVPLCVILGFWGVREFAFWLSGSWSVAGITAMMWKGIDWCYIFYGITTCLASILAATKPRWYLYQSLTTNILWVLPWAIVCEVGRLGGNLTEGNAWKWHGIVFGGSMVASFFCVMVVLAVWVVKLKGGRLDVGRVVG